MFIQQIHQTITFPEGHIAASIIKPSAATSLPALVFLAGSSGLKEHFAPLELHFAHKGFFTLAFDYRGRGESSGAPWQNTLHDQQYDLKRIISFLLYHQPVRLSSITLFGTSMGAFTAASVIDEISVNHLALSAPALYLAQHEILPLSQLKGHAREIIEDNQTKLHQASPFSHLPHFKGNCLILEHSEDTIIPQEIPQLYFNHCNQAKAKEYQVLKGIGHQVLSRPNWQAQLIKSLDNWLDQLNPVLDITPPSA